jgi:hypothetical protein
MSNTLNRTRNLPCEAMAHSPQVGQMHFHAVGGSSPLTFVSTIVVNECNLQQPKLGSNGKWQKVIEGACIEGEWERLVGSIGMIANVTDYKAQICEGNLSFGTAYASQDNYGMVFNNVFKNILIECILAGSSPSTSRGPRRVSGPNPFSRGPGGIGGATLACHDTGTSYCIILCTMH